MSRFVSTRPRGSRRKADSSTIGFFAVVILLIVLIGGCYSSYNANDYTTATVTSKDRTEDSTRVYTDKGTYQLSDAMFSFWRTDTADIYGRIRVCHKYEFQTVGWRFGPLSMFPNIETARDLGVDPDCTPED